MKKPNPVASIVTRWKCESCANNTYRVTPVMKKSHMNPGVITRLHLANLIQQRLNQK